MLLGGRVIAGSPVRCEFAEAARRNHLDLNPVKTPIPGPVLRRIIQHVPVAQVDDDLLREVGQIRTANFEQASARDLGKLF